MNSPKETKNLDIYGDPPLEWERVIGALDKIRDLEVADSASHYWIGTTRPDGRPHLAGVGIVWDDGKFYLSTGAGTQKGKNLAHDPRCTVSIAAPGIDIVAEGEAKIIRDEGELQRIADLFGGWGPQVRDGAFWHEFSAPSAVRRRGTCTRSRRRPSSRWRRRSRTAPPAGGCKPLSS